MFGFVLYFNVKFNDRDNEILHKTSSGLIDVPPNARRHLLQLPSGLDSRPLSQI
jgi:tRNA(Ile2) C34 agmatinyltransferase TiaS